jgi:hypothetical protein
MKLFSQIREKTNRMPPGEHVFDKKVGKVSVMVHKTKKGFVTYVDGDMLDTYKSKSEAERMGIQFAKELK